MLVKCPECGNEISSNSEACPNCGYVTKKPDPFGLIGCGGMLIFLAIFIFVGWGAGIGSIMFLVFGIMMMFSAFGVFWGKQ